MSKSKNKPKHQIQVVPKTDKQYLTTGMARRLPIVECWINPDWRQKGMSTIVLARQHKNGGYTMGSYLVDTFCLGLKQTMFLVNQSPIKYRLKLGQLFTSQDCVPVDYVAAHNIIYGGIAYADELGFKPEKDWVLTQYLLEADDDAVDLIDIEFGHNGRPFYMAGPYDKPAEVLAKLEKAVGSGNFDYIAYIRENDPLAYLNEEEEDDDDKE
ncbi:MAG: hypothetical protein LH609_15490 [Rudanella sp.]|nr:hypothetical protein [Rudanella sp.]